MEIQPTEKFVWAQKIDPNEEAIYLVSFERPLHAEVANRICKQFEEIFTHTKVKFVIVEGMKSLERADETT